MVWKNEKQQKARPDPVLPSNRNSHQIGDNFQAVLNGSIHDCPRNRWMEPEYLQMSVWICGAETSPGAPAPCRPHIPLWDGFLLLVLFPFCLLFMFLHLLFLVLFLIFLAALVSHSFLPIVRFRTSLFFCSLHVALFIPNGMLFPGDAGVKLVVLVLSPLQFLSGKRQSPDWRFSWSHSGEWRSRVPVSCIFSEF